MAERSLYAYEYVDVPFRDVTRMLAEDAAGVVRTATTSAAAHAEDVVARLTLDLPGFEVGRDVDVEVGAFDPVAITHVVVPLTWRAHDAAALFPSLRAALEVERVPVDRARTRIALVGAYAPPLGAFGAVFDAVVGHRIAEATVHRFVRDLARGIAASAGR